MLKVLLVVWLFCFGCYGLKENVSVVQANFDNRLEGVELTLKSFELYNNSQWITQPTATLAAGSTSNIFSAKTSSDVIAGQAIYGLPSFPRLNVTIQFYYKGGGPGRFTNIVAPSPFIGGVENIASKDGTVSFEAWVYEMCLEEDTTCETTPLNKARSRPGGISAETKPANDQVNGYVWSLLNEIETKLQEAGWNGILAKETTVPVRYATQVVAGTIYFVKVRIGSDTYVHVKIFKPLASENVQLMAVELQHSAVDQITYF